MIADGIRIIERKEPGFFDGCFGLALLLGVVLVGSIVVSYVKKRRERQRGFEVTTKERENDHG